MKPSRSMYAAVAVAVVLFIPGPLGASPARSGGAARSTPGSPSAGVAARPNIFFYNLDDLRDRVPAGIDPMQFMPKTRQWMAAGTRYTQSFVVDPACCPSRSSLMTGRYPHNNGVKLQSQGPKFDVGHSMGCYLQQAGMSTFIDGKFLTTWPKTMRPPCFDQSTVMWGGYRDVQVKVDGVAGVATGYSTTYLGQRGREYIASALATAGKPFLLYEAPQAPHWVAVTNSDGTISNVAVPSAKYKAAPVGPCAGSAEADRSDKPRYVRLRDFTTAQGQEMCESQLRAIMTADDEFGATMQLLSDRGVLGNTLVIFSSDNGYMWGEHGRTEKFVPYEPSIRVPLYVSWPGHIAAGIDSTRTVSYLDLLPTMLAAEGVGLPGGAPPLDGESLLAPSSRTTMFAEYYQDPANGHESTWKMVRTATVKYIRTYDISGALIFTEYYNLVTDPIENTNLLSDGDTSNDPPATELAALGAQLSSFARCAGSACIQ